MIKLIASSRNEKGRLFEEFAKLLLIRMGYIDIELRVSSNGSEIDFEAVHEISETPIMGECKAYTKEVNSETLQKFMGNFGPRWSKNNKLVGLFFTLSKLNSKAKEFFSFVKETPMGTNVQLREENDILDILYRHHICIRPEQLATRVRDFVDLPLGETYLAFFKSKLVWIQIILDAQGNSAEFTGLDADGIPLYKSFLEEIKDLDADIRHLKVCDLTQARGKVFSLTAVPEYITSLIETCGKRDEPLIELKVNVEEGSDILDSGQPLLGLTKPLTQQPIGREPIERIVNIMDTTDRLLVLGDPGSGKTTSLYNYAIILAKRYLDKKQAACIPVIVDLSRYGGEGLLNMLQNSFADFQFDVPTPLLNDFLKEGTLVVLIDGLNEVQHVYRSNVRREIANLLRRYPKNKVIATSRKEGYDEAFPLKKCTIKEPTDEEIAEFIQSYLRKAGEDAYAAKSIVWEMPPAIRELGRNPLMLSLIVRLLVRDKEIPRLRANLFEDFTNYFLGEWERKVSSLDLNIKKRLLARLAYKMNERETTILDYDSIKMGILTELRNLEGTEGTRVSVLDALNELLLNGIIVRKGDRFKFMHQSFQDFFSAHYLVENKIYLQFIERDWWKNVYIFVVGLLQYPDDVVLEGLKKNGIFFAGRCVFYGNPVAKETLFAIKNAFRNTIEDERRNKIVREKAIDALGQIGDSDDSRFLFKILRKCRTKALRYALVSSMARGEGSVEINEEKILIELLKEKPDFLLALDYLYLIYRKFKNWEEILLRWFSRGDIPLELRILIGEYLLHLRNESGVSVVMHIIEDPQADDSTKALAFRVLAEFAREVYTKSEDTDIQEWVFKHKDLIHAIMKFVSDERQDAALRRVAVYSVPLHATEARNTLLNLLSNVATPRVIRESILNRLCDEVHFALGYEPIILGILENKGADLELRKIAAGKAHAAFAINSAIHQKLTKARLKILLSPRESMELKSEAAIGLGWDGQYENEHDIAKTPRIDESLLQELRETKNEEYRKALVEALVRRKVKDVIVMLADTIENDREELKWRKRCCVFLYWMACKEALDRLVAYAKSNELEPEIRTQCTSVLPDMLLFRRRKTEVGEARELIIDTLTELIHDAKNEQNVVETAFESLAKLVEDDELLVLEKKMTNHKRGTGGPATKNSRH